MNEKIIIANWKMNVPNLADWDNLKETKGVEIVICPPFTQLNNLKTKKLKDTKLGAQNCFWENEGAYTGEISPVMLKKLGVEYVIIGHSERRQILGETDEMINKKVLAALGTGLKVILCVGEIKKGLAEAKNYVSQQLKEDLKGVRDSLVVAYEPVWAIGTGNYCQPEDALEMINYIKKIVSNFGFRLPAEASAQAGISDFRVLYGGSVNSQNIVDYVKYPEIDGALVGGASLKIDEFQKIINEVSKTIKT